MKVWAVLAPMVITFVLGCATGYISRPKPRWERVCVDTGEWLGEPSTVCSFVACSCPVPPKWLQWGETLLLDGGR